MASCSNCKKGAVLPGEPTGTMVNGAYFAAGPEGNTSRAIILLTDIFGLPLVNCKIIADNISKRLECDCWVPDLFDGKPPITTDKLKVPERVGEKINWFSLLYNALPSFPAMLRNRPTVAYPKAEKFVRELQVEKKYGKLGAVGYCFGGTLAVSMASTDLLNSVVICHPGSVTEAAVQAIKIPSAWACAEEDMGFKPEIRRKAEETLASRKGKDNFVEYEFKDYKGTVHGFAARPNLAYPEVKAGYEGAFEQTIEWFQKTLPI
ncbi:dienelactone hydrolase endo-1-3,1,4-beta-D-glucanase [Lentinula detonsa]|uniref:Dienelactone hydrolase endo-1-3,1,4-beta-D-glucanase n=1 Tax=Lentinula detonsa TaxID=2804962 RepID=A0A9W8TZY2_9AGAR|nr:dienelactone hydrolase endo-1-3,1,4-beta-D-glucanase [Lentinula detonsa]